MPALAGRDGSNNASSRRVTLADVEWLALPASPEIPRSRTDRLQNAPYARIERQLRQAPPPGNLLQLNGTREGSEDDSDTWDAPELRVTNAFQRLMKRSKTFKNSKTEQR
jgi:hypothetical protein